jgi:hypothetical protein
MSHFTTIAIEINNGDLLEQALQSLGYPVKQNTLVRGYLGDTTTANYVIPMPLAFGKQVIATNSLQTCGE